MRCVICEFENPERTQCGEECERIHKTLGACSWVRRPVLELFSSGV